MAKAKRNTKQEASQAQPARTPGGVPQGLKRALYFVGAVFLTACAVYTALTMVIMGNGIAIGIVGTVVFAAVGVRLFRMGMGEDMGTLRRHHRQ